MIRGLCQLLIAAGVVVTASTQAPAAGSISGRIIAADSGKPLAGASVRLAAFAGAGTANASATTATGEKGEFSFGDLAPGRYYITASKPRYLTLTHGQRPGSGLQGVSIEVSAGAQITGVTIALPLASVIAGRVDDERGEPAMGANVSAWIVEWRNGERSVRSVAFDVVDDRGQFRITNLPPGQFVVSAFRPVATPGAAKMLYHPGTADPSLAVPFSVEAGAERAGVNFMFPAAGPAAGVSGKVVAGGKPVANVRVLATALNAVLKGFDVKSTYTTRTGEFRIDELAPGPYRLTAWADPGTRSESEHIALLEVVVDTVLLKDVELALRPGSRATGTVTGLPVESPARPTITLQPLDRDGRNSAVHWARVEDDQFSIRGVMPGRYAIAVGGLPDGVRVSSIRQDGRDVHDLPVTIGVDQEVSGIAVTLSRGPTVLEGTLFDRSGAPTPDYLVVVFPEEAQYRWPGTPRIKADQPSSDGRFTFTNLPPGKYRLAVVTDAEAGEWLVPEFLQKLVPASVAISLTAGPPVTQDLRMK